MFSTPMCTTHVFTHTHTHTHTHTNIHVHTVYAYINMQTQVHFLLLNVLCNGFTSLTSSYVLSHHTHHNYTSSLITTHTSLITTHTSFITTHTSFITTHTYSHSLLTPTHTHSSQSHIITPHTSLHTTRTTHSSLPHHIHTTLHTSLITHSHLASILMSPPSPLPPLPGNKTATVHTQGVCVGGTRAAGLVQRCACLSAPV